MEGAINSRNDTQVANSDQNCLILNISENEFSQSEEVSDDPRKTAVEEGRASFAILTADGQIIDQEISDEYQSFCQSEISENSDSGPATAYSFRLITSCDVQHEQEDVLENHVETVDSRARLLLGCAGHQNNNIAKVLFNKYKSRKKKKVKNVYNCSSSGEADSVTGFSDLEDQQLLSNIEAPLLLRGKPLAVSVRERAMSGLQTENLDSEVVSEGERLPFLMLDGFSDENLQKDSLQQSKVCPTSLLGYPDQGAVKLESTTSCQRADPATNCKSVKERLGTKVERLLEPPVVTDSDDDAFKNHRVVITKPGPNLNGARVLGANGPCSNNTQQRPKRKGKRFRAPVRKQPIRSCTITSERQMTRAVPQEPPVAPNALVPIGTLSSGPSDLISSDDLEENVDHVDPDWQYLMRLNSDDERYRATRKRWKNLTIPNPNANLTKHNHRVRVATREAETRRGRKRTLLPTPFDQPAAKRFKTATGTCSGMFAARMGTISDDFKDRELFLIDEFNSKMDHVIMSQATELKNLRLKWRGILSNGGYPRRQRYHAELLAIRRQHQLQRNNLVRKRHGALEAVWNERQAKMRKMVEAREEILAVHRFYYGLKNSTNEDRDANHLDEKQMMDIEDCEKMYSLYDAFYA